MYQDFFFSLLSSAWQVLLIPSIFVNIHLYFLLLLLLLHFFFNLKCQRINWNIKLFFFCPHRYAVILSVLDICIFSWLTQYSMPNFIFRKSYCACCVFGKFEMRELWYKCSFQFPSNNILKSGAGKIELRKTFYVIQYTFSIHDTDIAGPSNYVCLVANTSDSANLDCSELWLVFYSSVHCEIGSWVF